MPLAYNVGIEIAEFAYIFFIIALMNHLAGSGKISNPTARKVIHLWLGGLIPFWFLFDSKFAQWLFIVPVAVSVLLILFGTFVKGSHVRRMARFVRGTNLKEALFGPLMFMLIFVLFTFIAFKSVGGVAALCAMTFGDGIAPIVGAYAKHKYFGGRKSVEGSLALFMATLLSIFVMFLIFFPNASYSILFVAILAAAVATVVEALTPGKYDNLTVSIATWLVFLAV